MKKKSKKNEAKRNTDHSLDYSVASTNDCTGLMPTPALSENDEVSYTDIYNIPRPKDKANRNPGRD